MTNRKRNFSYDDLWIIVVITALLPIDEALPASWALAFYCVLAMVGFVGVVVAVTGIVQDARGARRERQANEEALRDFRDAIKALEEDQRPRGCPKASCQAHEA